MTKISICVAALLIPLVVGNCQTKDSLIVLRIDSIEVSFHEADAGIIKYDNQAAIAYAKRYSGSKANSCGRYLDDASLNQSDCAHFVAHCLKAGGITVPNPDATNQLCPERLAVRVKDVISALRGLDTKYTNITEIDFDEIPIIGDYGFLKTPVFRPTHAFMVCTPAADPNDIKMYAHTRNRNCEKGEPRWYQFFDTAFRITDR